MSGVTGIVLAAGASERMGESKLLLPFRESTVLNATIASVEASRVDRVIIVTGARADEIEDSVVSYRATIARNPDYRRGNMSSLMTATAGDPDADVFILVPGDQPTIRVAAIEAMIAVWAEEHPWAAVTEYSDRIAHPFLLSRRAIEAIQETTGEKVLGRLLVDSDDDQVVRLSDPNRAPRDVNTPEDYETLLTD